MKTGSPGNDESKTGSSILAASVRMKALYDQGHYEESLNICLQMARQYPDLPDVWTHAAGNSLRLGRAQDAIRYGQTALARGGQSLELYDLLSHVHGDLRQWDEARRHGLQALNMRDRRFGGQPVIAPPEPIPLPPPPSAQTREHNIIAFSLFGSSSRYCEPAILNVQEQSGIYPHWVCRFY